MLSLVNLVSFQQNNDDNNQKSNKLEAKISMQHQHEIHTVNKILKDLKKHRESLLKNHQSLYQSQSLG